MHDSHHPDITLRKYNITRPMSLLQVHTALLKRIIAFLPVPAYRGPYVEARTIVSGYWNVPQVAGKPPVYPETFEG